MRAINVWAWHEQHVTGPQERNPICSDASASTRRMGNAGIWVGRAGWHFAIPFSTLTDLAEKLETATLPDYIGGEPRTMRRGEVQTLGIDCHGSDGEFYPNGIPGTAVNARNLDRFGGALRRIGLMTASRQHEASVPNPPHRLMRLETVGASTIVRVAYNTAAGRRGSRLLEQLSYRWPDRRVVGFSTTVVFPRLPTVEDPAGGVCAAPFALDSGVHGLRSSEADAWMEENRPRMTEDPRRIPFADAGADNAKIALNGRIVDYPANEPRRRAALEPALMGPGRGNVARPTGSAQGGRRIV